MATATREIVSIARAIASCGKTLKQAKAFSDQSLARNSVEAFDWGGTDEATADAALAEAGIDYTAAEVSNAIGSLAAFQTWWETHGQNFELLTDPIV